MGERSIRLGLFYVGVVTPDIFSTRLLSESFTVRNDILVVSVGIHQDAPLEAKTMFVSVSLTKHEAPVWTFMGMSPDDVLTTVTELVSDATGRPIEDLPPLTTALDPGAFTELVTNSHDVAVTFTYAGQRVFVHSETAVYVQPIYDEEDVSVDRLA